MNDVRGTAANIITSLLNGNGSLTSAFKDLSSHPEISLLKELCFGTCRWFYLLEYLLNQLLSSPLRKKEVEIKCLLLVGLYQLRELSIPQHAVINETVQSAIALRKPWAKGLINAVLRNYQRRAIELDASISQAGPQISLSCADWLKEEVASAWPLKWKEILNHSNYRPPLTLRVNLGKKSRKDVLVLLTKNKIEAVPGRLAHSAIYLKRPMPADEIPGLQEGWVSIQDEASQIVPDILQLNPQQSVLDACAAPGGKTCGILESEHSLSRMLSLDFSGSRLERMAENLERLQLKSTLITGDARSPGEWWDGQLFDRILLDAPCSATGVIRRHPDLKILRTSDEVTELEKIQSEILNSLWPCLREDGLLLYTTCSILPRENNLQIKRFLESTNNAKYEGIVADWGVECGYGRQLLTGLRDGPDGFFYSLLRKV
ncbi:MAG: 16S rRNA (cytosine(967)-C(5))-methyltransferase RsmB [Gammaproteobacteria bacterium]|nr:16S rRNA (cytosine(967)-C(5))-methyltransferase RsmB [Gammaproteobacteria bacterium]